MGMGKRSSEERTDIVVQSWLNTIGDNPSVRVEVYRVFRASAKASKYGIKLGHFDYLPELEDIRGEYGGGKFRLVLKRPDDKGRLLYSACRTVEIAGPPAEQSEAGDRRDGSRIDKLEARVQQLEKVIQKLGG